MMYPFNKLRKSRGSALLIVLGLLSFLMISAVAFSIAMRTEHAAASTYRRNLMARELLATAFTDARATVESELKRQNDGFVLEDLATHTRKRLWPFKYASGEDHARILSSGDGDPTSTVEAPLLDDQMMAHVPPYLAAEVYNILERGEQPVSGKSDPTDTQSGSGFFDHSPRWKSITAQIPESDVKVDGSTQQVTTSVIGRMAWAAVNVSEMLDINGLGSASPYRGVGFTVNELAFGSNNTAVPADEIYDLLNTSNDASGAISLPVFFSNADLAAYTSYDSSASGLNASSGLFSWEDAVANNGNDWYSPFGTYSFWPATNRIDELAGTVSVSSTAVSCSEVNETTAVEGESVSDRILSKYTELTDDPSDARSVLAASLLDYIDADSVPATWMYDSDEARNARPTVEAVPMISEVYFEGTGKNKWDEQSNDLAKEIEKAVQEAINDVQITGLTSKDAAKLESDIQLDIGKDEMEVQARTYFPSYETANGNFKLAIEGTTAVLASVSAAGTVTECTPTNAKSDIDADGGDVGADLFSTSQMVPLSINGTKIKLAGSGIPVVNLDKTSPDAYSDDNFKVTLTVMLDYCFRVKLLAGNSVVDLAPCDQGKLTTVPTYPKTFADRLTESSISKYDANHFRVTRAVQLTFALQWVFTEIPGEGSTPTTYSATLKLADGAGGITSKAIVGNVESADVQFKTGSAKIKLNGPDKASNATPFYTLTSPAKGVWCAIDPRYNWLSPMLGLKNATTGGYGVSLNATDAPLSSPHWIFHAGDAITSGSNASQDMQDYQSANMALVPFSYGLNVEDIRYGYNDSDQLFFPGELGFLPVPLSLQVLHRYQYNYGQYTLSTYYDQVAKASFFRTIPAVDFADGAFSGVSTLDYAKCEKIVKMLSGFSGKSIPEEHRSLIHVFAGQDNYLLAQQLRQFALLGMAPSVKQAAYVSRKRIESAESAHRASKEMLKVLPEIKSFSDADVKTSKFDKFIRENLFPLPENFSSDAKAAAQWSDGRPRPTTLDFLSDPQLDLPAKLREYNTANSEKLGQNDLTTLLSTAKECFGDRQQLFLYLLRADAIAYNSGRDLAQHKPMSTARAVALVWRDAYGKLPDRVIYYQVLP